MKKDSVKPVLDNWRKGIDCYLRKALSPEKNDKFTRINEVMLYTVFPGGKRIRPVLAIASANACGTSYEKAVASASAVEMIHCYSLIHDDLPSMDNSDSRRGKPSAHRKFNEGLAVLAGDALLTKAFETIAGCKNIPEINKVKAIICLAQASGHKGMIGGQVVDTFFDYKNLPKSKQEQVLDYIHTHKTGDLIEASVLIGGLIAGASSKELLRLRSYGRKIGLAFQVIDDVFDSDEDMNKLTYPNFYGLEKSKELAFKLIKDAKKELEIFKGREKYLNYIADYVVERQN
ncbi:MAG: hypothetical protein A2252_03565 [Elusimicrobia bacterium RIFOXYA2_FULL_39_19]|nr:MAG: hypothetical protein A2252_03565 [Elusimicrobia bacterium RIFOXYA2_FULL_39_19]